MASLIRSVARARTGGFASFSAPQTAITRRFPVQRRAVHDESTAPEQPPTEAAPPQEAPPKQAPSGLTTDEIPTAEQRKAFEAELEAAIDAHGLREETNAMRSSMEKDVFNLEREADFPRAVPRLRPGQTGFWAMDEEDEFAMTKDGDDHFNDDDITSMAHSQLQEHRDLRELARIAVWEMPLLSSKY